jgi:hypothetical protein
LSAPHVVLGGWTSVQASVGGEVTAQGRRDAGSPCEVQGRVEVEAPVSAGRRHAAAGVRAAPDAAPKQRARCRAHSVDGGRVRLTGRLQKKVSQPEDMPPPVATTS